MSDFQKFVTEKLAKHALAINNITANAKTIPELPAQNVLNPSSVLHVSIGGISQRLSIQDIIDAIMQNSYDQILSISAMTLVGNNLSIPAGATWKINNAIYQTITTTVINIPYCATGLKRSDILVANTLGQIVKITGSENAGIIIRPTVPINCILITEINITDNSIDGITNPTVPTSQEIILTYTTSYDFTISTGLRITQVIIGKTYDAEISEYTYNTITGAFSLIGDAQNLGLDNPTTIRIRTF